MIIIINIQRIGYNYRMDKLGAASVGIIRLKKIKTIPYKKDVSLMILYRICLITFQGVMCLNRFYENYLCQIIG